MKEKNQGVCYRDVQTLLFCKAVPSPRENFKKKIQGEKHTQNYKALLEDIHKAAKPAEGKKRKTFLTFGGYDALCIYPTKLESCNEEWLRDIYVDKQTALRKSSENVLYHQIHLVSQNPDTQNFWAKSDENYPFFLTTLIYGVNVRQYNEKTGRDVYCDEEQICSPYEKVIRWYLENLQLEEKAAVKYAVYNGITVSDVIILWKAKDLMDAMKLLSRIEYSGIARKTLSTLGFPVDENGNVENYVSDYLIDNLHKRTTISLHGAVRDINAFTKIRGELANPEKSVRKEQILARLKNLVQEAYQDREALKKLSELLGSEWTIERLEAKKEESQDTDEFLSKLSSVLEEMDLKLCCAIPERSWTQNLGKNDFAVSARVSYANLANLLDMYQDRKSVV